MIQVTVQELPFGGVGESGHGAYHGKRTFDLFTYERATMRSRPWLEFLLATRYPPYTPEKLNTVRKNKRRITFPRPGTQEEAAAEARGNALKWGAGGVVLAALAGGALKYYGKF
jgi:hypothetical protein